MAAYHEKAERVLGVNAGTARNRLVKDTLFRLAVAAGHKCYRCGGELDRQTFSIEHITPWLNSDDPVRLFYDQDNITFSHLSCNSSAGEKVPRKPVFTKEEARQRKRASWSSEKRREKYRRLGT